jgi:hypothetical protein
LNSEELNNELFNELYDVQRLIDHLEFENPMAAQDFITVDDNIITEVFTDEEIIQTVRPTQNNKENDNNDEDDEVEPIQPISVTIALYSLDNILSFLSNPPNEFTVDLKTITTIRSLRSQVSLYNFNNKKQVNLEQFIDEK